MANKVVYIMTETVEVQNLVNIQCSINLFAIFQETT